ncbi:MAG TPA: type II toxin-antitoxin system VapC family toxin [Verrucomicrobiae bacterium]|nr:type II toxin-antitoxin system VapC family toxin [Verrucomicrobiae bacterium]
MAAPEVLIDTAGFLALWDASDEHHHRAVQLQSALARKKGRFLTTDYIVDETATLLLKRHSHAAAADFLKTVLGSRALRVEWIDADRFVTAAELFSRHDDKEWSFTDCVSFALMRELKIRDSFTTDHHFTQAGFNPLLKSPA